MSKLSALTEAVKIFGGKKNINEKTVSCQYYVVAQTFSADESNVYTRIIYEKSDSFVAALDATSGDMKWIVRDQSDGSRWVYLSSYILAGPLLIAKDDGSPCFDFRTVEGFTEPDWPYAFEINRETLVVELSEADSPGQYVLLNLADCSYEIVDLGVKSARLYNGHIYGWGLSEDVYAFYRLNDLSSAPELICSLPDPVDFLIPRFCENYIVYRSADLKSFTCIDCTTSSSKIIQSPTEGGAVTPYKDSLFVVRNGLWRLDILDGTAAGPFLADTVEWNLAINDGVLYSVEKRADATTTSQHFVCAYDVNTFSLLWERKLELPGNGVFLGEQGIYVEPVGNSGAIQFFKYVS